MKAISNNKNKKQILVQQQSFALRVPKQITAYFDIN